MEKLHEANQMFVMVDCVREMIVKKSCKYGRYVSLLLLFMDLHVGSICFEFESSTYILVDVHVCRSIHVCEHLEPWVQCLIETVLLFFLSY